MGISAEAYGYKLEGTTLEIEKIMVANPRRIGEIKVEVNFPEGSNFTDKQKRVIEAAAKSCPVYNTLAAEVQKSITFNW